MCDLGQVGAMGYVCVLNGVGIDEKHFEATI